MRSKRRRERKSNRPTDVYRLLNKNLGTNWLVCILTGLVFFLHLMYGLESGFTILRGFITIFMGLIFIQSIRAILKLRHFKKMIMINPHSVTKEQVSSAPYIKSLFWLP